MATSIATPMTQQQPPPGGIYPDNIDAGNFTYILENTNHLESYNRYIVEDRIQKYKTSNIFVETSYCTGVPSHHFNIVHEAMQELFYIEHPPNRILYFGKQEGLRIYIHVRDRDVGDKKHLGTVWIFKDNHSPELYIIMKK
jgi:hypothetical protein